MMASAKDDVFLKVEAVLSVDWIKNSGRELTTVLEEIENLGIDSIGFSRGNHVLVGSMDQLVRIREHFLGKTKNHSPSAKATAVHTEPFGGYNHPERRSERKRNDLPKKFPLFADPEREEADVTDAPRAVKSNRDRPRPGIAPPSKPNSQVISKELMVDNDIWEYMESKKRDELNDLETMFGAALTKAEDDSGVLKIAIVPKSGDTTSDEVVIMHETLVGLYQETFMKCVIEKHEVHVSDEETELMLDYISDRFPMVFAKRCIYNDDFLFIGPPRMAREARQQFQVLAQRLRKGELKAKVDNLGSARGRGYERYDRHEDDMYGESPYDYTNEFQNALNEDVIHVENRPKRRESFTEDEGRGMSPGGDVAEPLNDEEDEPKVEEKKPRLNLTKDFEATAADFNRRDKNRHGKLTDDAKQQSGASSLVYWRQDNEEFEDTKRCSSDVEDDDRKQEFTAKNVEIKKGKKGDEFQHDIPDRKSRKSPKTDDTSEFSQNESKTPESTSSLCDDDIYNDDENKTGSAKAAKSLDDVSHRNKWQTEEDDQVPKKVSQTARIDADSITHRSADLDFTEPQAEVTTKILFDEFINNDDADEKLVLPERSEKKPRKKTYDLGPKVKIIKQAFPIVTDSGDNAQIEVGFESKAVDEPKVTSEKSNVHAATEGATAGATVKRSHGEILGAPSRVPGYLEELELREVFRAQKKTLKKMPFDSASSEDDSDDAADRATLRRGRKENKDELTQERIEELMACGDEASQKLLQSLLDKATNDAGGKVADVVDKGKVESDVVVVVDGAAHGGARPKVEAVPAVEKPAAAGRQRKPKNHPTVPQPPDGNIGCVIDKAFHLEGHDKSGTIEINISFEDGNQADDQLEPGRPYKALTMKAFLPASGDGRETLRLMKAAFAARKLFALEGKVDDDEDVIVPNGVNFKDNIDLYPDPGYLPKVMEQLRLLTEDQDK